jgi:hypothetical protein
MTQTIKLTGIKRLFGGWVWGSPLLWWSTGAAVYALLIGQHDITTIWSASVALVTVLFIWAKAIPAAVAALHRRPANEIGIHWESALWTRLSRFIDVNPVVRTQKIMFGMTAVLVAIFGVNLTGFNLLSPNKINTVAITAMLFISILKEWNDLERHR